MTNQCPLCGHVGAFAIVNMVARNDTPQTSVSCSRCAFVFVDPMPSEAELRTYYASGQYRREFPPLRSEAEEEEIAKGAAEWLTQHFGLTGSERLLEMGCGFGRVAALLGADGIEVDPATWEVARARGVGESSYINEAYDVVYAMQVLEHSPDPVGELRLWRNSLRSGGKLHVQVPTLERMYGGASYFFQRPHVVNFTARTLAAALRIAGFDIVEVGISDSVLYATATAGEPKTYDEIAATLGPIDDVAALIARHEAQQAAQHDAGVFARWMSGEAMTAATEPTIRTEVAFLAESYGRMLHSLQKLHLDLLAHGEALATEWSEDAHLHGYLQGKSREAATLSVVVGALANQAMNRAMNGGERA
jgi:SAM-dependent methyltransferase